MRSSRNWVVSCALAGLTAGAFAGSACAHEPGDFGQYIRGFTIGDPLGVNPPPGLYFENTTLFVPSATGQGQMATQKMDGMLDTPLLLWSTGWTFLGASVSAAISQPFYQVDAWSETAVGPPFAGTVHYPTIHNTWINPVTLSWALAPGLFASAAFDFYVPDGSRYSGTLNPDYWTFEPRASISYLGGGWDLTATFVYNINTASQGQTGGGGFAATPFANGYRSGDQAFVDLTATKKFGKWEIGPVAYLKWQTTDDTPGAGVSCAAMAAASAGLATCGRASDIAVGGLVGYDFGPVAAKVFVTDSVATKDDFGGLFVWTKLSFRLWGPDAPATARPLITK